MGSCSAATAVEDRRHAPGRTLSANPEVCLLTSFPAPRPFGRIADALSGGFRELGSRLDVVYVRGQGEDTDDGVVRTLHLGAPRVRKAGAPIARYLHRARPRVTFTCPTSIAVFAVVLGRLSRNVVVPWEVTLLDRDVASSPYWLGPKVKLLGQRLGYGFAPGIAVVSSDVGDDVVANCWGVEERDLHALSNPLDIDAVATAADEPPPGGTTGGFTICASGRLAPQKGLDVLLEALAKAGPELPSDWRLVILGEGWWKGELEAIAAELDLSERITFLGRIANPYPVMRAADLFVHPARWEGFGLVLTEALSLGLPIVASDCPGGPREILGEGRYGVLVPPEQPGALGSAIVRLAADEAERNRLGQLGPSRAADFSPAAIAARMLEVASRVGESREPTATRALQ
jgi:glycosyltransferase involved in cell wall biosynthesis